MKNEKWTEPDMESGSAFLPQVSELWFIMKKFQWEHIESKAEMTERQAWARIPLLLLPPYVLFVLTVNLRLF